ncbi:hypothetical protein CsSME_00022775 [Camellia sinensis var. sinensis]
MHQPRTFSLSELKKKKKNIPFKVCEDVGEDGHKI